MCKNKNTYDVLGIGYICIDNLITIPRYPSHNTKTRALNVFKQGGGQTATAIAALATWGLKTCFIGCIGDDQDGTFLLEELQQENVDVSRVIIRKGCSSHRSFILVDEITGERTIIWHRPKSLDLSGNDLHLDTLPDVRAVHMDGHEIQANQIISAWATKQNAIVSLDLETSVESISSLLPFLTILIQSNDILPGHPTPFGDKQALEKLRATRVPVTGITFGAQGTIIQDLEKQYPLTAIPVEVMDTTGAGDIFHAAILYGVLQSWPLKMSVQFAVIASGLSCTRIGGRNSIPSLEQIFHHPQFREYSNNL